MAYTLQAVVARSGEITSGLEGSSLVPLAAGFEMIPLTESCLEAHSLALLPLTDEGLEQLPESLFALCSNLSNNCSVAYIEAEFWGGTGTQAFAAFQNGKLSSGPHIGSHQINSALAWLGCEASASKDEFDTVGLGGHRSTEGWLRNVEV